MSRKIKITCDEATTICDKSQYGEASFFEKIQLNIHLLFCKICSKYVKQNRTLSAVFKIKSTDCKEHKQCLSNADKEAFKKELQELTE